MYCWGRPVPALALGVQLKINLINNKKKGFCKFTAFINTVPRRNASEDREKERQQKRGHPTGGRKT